MYTIVIEAPTLLNRTFLWSSRKVSNRISTELYRFRKRLGISRSCSDISSAKSETTRYDNSRVASCQLRVASCQLRVGFYFYFVSCELRVASCELRVASWFPSCHNFRF